MELPINAIHMADRFAIADIIHRFYWLIDHGRAADTAALFAKAARLTFGPGAPKPGTISGQDIALAVVARGEQTGITTRHVLSNILLTQRPDGSVTAYSLLTLFRTESATRDSYPASIADIDEVYVRDAGTWLIRERTVTPIFSRSMTNG
jgi:hypothetical protein